MTSFLEAHFTRFMDSYKDGTLVRAQAEDFTFNLNAATSDEQVAAVYCIINDLEPAEWVDRLVSYWRTLRETTPPPIPDNVVLGES